MNKENKILIILIIIFLLLVGIYLIYRLFNEEVAKDKTNNKVYDNYELISEEGYFKNYLVDIVNNKLLVNIDNNIINYNDNSLTVNGVNIINDISLFNNIVFYGKSIVFTLYNIYSGIEMFVIFNIDSNDYKIIDQMDDMRIINIDNTAFFEAGMSFHISSYYDNKLHINNKEHNLCKYNNNEVISKNIIYFYDYPAQEFIDIEVIETNKVNSFKKKYC